MDFPSWFGCINNITLGIYTHVPAWFSYTFLETTFLIQRFLTFFIYSMKTRFLFLRSTVLPSTVYHECFFFQSAFQLNLLYRRHSVSITTSNLSWIKGSISLLISIKPAHLKSDSTGALLGLSWHQGFRIRDFIWPWMIFNNSFQE